MKVQLKYKSWDDISISLYKEIVKVTSDKSLSDIEIEMSLLALLSGVDEDSVWSLSVMELQNLLPQLDFITDFKFNTNWKSRHIMLDNQRFSVCVDMTKFTVAQYVDFQQFWSMKDNVENMHRLLSTMLIPEGHSYNEGYDIMEVQSIIENHCPITTANALLFFYLRMSLDLTRAFQIVFQHQLKRMMRKNKMNPEMLRKMKEAEQMLISLDGCLS